MTTPILKTLAVIPSRLQSTRLPKKPIADIEGKSLIQRVWEQAKKARLLNEIVIATDSEEIATLAKSFGATVVMTGSDNLTGSDRVAEAAHLLAAQGKKFDLIANVQGDMPFIHPEVIDRTIQVLSDAPPEVGMSTVATPLFSEEEFLRPSTVKAVLGVHGDVLYFSRAQVPFIREPKELVIGDDSPYGYKHMGLYVFRPETLARMKTLPQSLPEIREKLEQLRALSNGIRIRAAIVGGDLVKNQVEVDTPEDLARARAIAKSPTY